MKEKRIVALCSSTKREVSQFHVEVLQRRQRYVQRNRDARAKLLFCLLNVLLFSRSCGRRRCLSSLIFLSPLYYHPYFNEVLKMKFLLSQVPIKITEGLDPLTLLTDNATIAQWNNENLPSDRMSTENATILTNCERWPLMIDPQLQGVKWIKTREGEELRVVRLGQKG